MNRQERLARIQDMLRNTPLTSNEIKLCFPTVNKRDIERDIKELEETGRISPINNGAIRNRCWHATGKAPSLDVRFVNGRTAIALNLLEEHLRCLLPSGIYADLEPLFSKANSELKQSHNQQYRRWLNKVRVARKGPTLSTPPIDHNVLSDTQTALFNEKQISFTYRAVSSGVERQHTNLNPQGLFSRDGMIYLIAHKPGKKDPAFFALNRMRDLKVLSSPSEKNSSFDIDSEILKIQNRSGAPKTIQLKAEICTSNQNSYLRRYLEERRLGEDQKIEDLNGKSILTVTTALTDELEKWILSEAGTIRIIEPFELRTSIIRKINNLVLAYKQN